LPISAITLQTANALVCSLLARVEVLAICFAVPCQRRFQVAINAWRGQAHFSNFVAAGPAHSLAGSVESESLLDIVSAVMIAERVWVRRDDGSGVKHALGA
jgi:hypothetical protein